MASATIRLPSEGSAQQSLSLLMVVADSGLERWIRDLLTGAGLDENLAHAGDVAVACQLLDGQRFNCVIAESSHAEPLLVHAGFEGHTAPVLMVTGEVDEGDAMTALQAGAADYIALDEVDPTGMRRAVLYAVERGRILRELAEANARLQQLAIRNPATNLLNRRGLEQLFGDRALLGRNQAGHVLSVRADGLDVVEAEGGSEVVELIEREIADTVRSCFRSDDILAHLAPGRLLVILTSTRDAEASMLVERLRPRLEDSIEMAAGAHHAACHVALGLSRIPVEVSGLVGLLALAERSTDAVADSLDPEVEELRALLEQEGAFSVETTTVTDLRANEAAALLLRAVPLGSELEAHRLAPLARKASLLAELDEQRLVACLEPVAQLPGDARIILEVLPETLQQQMDTIVELLQHYGNPRRFWMSVSEQQLIGDPMPLKDAVRTLRKTGASLMLHDVGFGQSSLESLIALEPEAVVVSGRWIQGVARDDGIWRTLQRLVRACEALGAFVIADGLTSTEEIKTVRSVGVLWGIVEA